MNQATAEPLRDEAASVFFIAEKFIDKAFAYP